MKHETTLAVGVGFGQIGWVFLKIGFVFFGGGFVLIPVLHREIVTGLHWLTDREFLDGVAISQLTPGPIAVLATFCGFHQGGVLGALIATVAIFLPAFAFMVAVSHSYGHLSKIASVRAVLSVVIPAIVGLLLGSAVQIGAGAVSSTAGVIVFVMALIVMTRWKISPSILIAAAAALGLILKL